MRPLAVACALLLLASAGQAEDWPTFHRDPGRTGVSGEAGLSRGPLTETWATSLDPESVDSSPAVVGDRVYVGTATGRVCCVSVETGELVWQTRVGGAVASSPTVVGDRLFVGSADRCLYALETTTGKVLWRVRTRGAVFASPLAMGDRVCFGSMDGRFRCVGAATGDLLWSAQEAGGISASAAGADDLVYYGDEAGSIVARSLADGSARWTAGVKGGIIAAPSIAGNRLLVPVMSGTALAPPNTDCLTVLDRATGARLWAVTRQSSVMHTPVADDTLVYFATVSGYLSETELLACRLTDGVVAWKLGLGGVADSSPALIGGRLVFGNHDGGLHVVNAADGRLVQSLSLGAKVFASPAIAGGRVFVGAQDGKLHCLK